MDWDVTQFAGGVTTGGVNRRMRCSGHGDYLTNFDLGKLCDRQGLFLKVRAEHRFGVSASPDTGALLPATTPADLPVFDSEDLYLTNVLFTQFLSERFAVFAGKVDTFDGDHNAFASGRGETQFSNLGFIVNPVALKTIPYSTLGCGFAIFGEEGIPRFAFNVLNATDTTKTAGFDELFEEGVSLSTELRLPTHFFGMPGHQLVGAGWNSRDYTSFGQDPRILLPNVPINETTSTWSAFWNFDQFFYVDPHYSHQGWGVFGRAGIADQQVSAIDWFLSFGVGGHNPFSGHEADTFGAGWYYNSSSDDIGPIFEAIFGPIADGNTVELFYNWQATPWLNLTTDAQVIVPARQEVDTVLLLTLRAVVKL